MHYFFHSTKLRLSSIFHLIFSFFPIFGKYHFIDQYFFVVFNYIRKADDDIRATFSLPTDILELVTDNMVKSVETSTSKASSAFWPTELWSRFDWNFIYLWINWKWKANQSHIHCIDFDENVVTFGICDISGVIWSMCSNCARNVWKSAELYVSDKRASVWNDDTTTKRT